MQDTTNTPSDKTDAIDEIIATGTIMVREMWLLHGGHPDDAKALVSALFLARTVRQLNAVDQLINARFFADGQCLYRSMLERALLYEHLCRNAEFQTFNDWCFIQVYENENAIKSDERVAAKPKLAARKFSPEDKARYKRAKADPRVTAWKRPDPKDSAKLVNLRFLYPAGYDYASTFVHPTTYDGIDDLNLLLLENPPRNTEADRALRQNARLAAWQLCRYVVDQPEWKWDPEMYKHISDLARILEARTDEPSPRLPELLRKHRAREPVVALASPGASP